MVCVQRKSIKLVPAKLPDGRGVGARTMGREGELLSLCHVDVNVFNKWHDLYLQ